MSFGNSTCILIIFMVVVSIASFFLGEKDIIQYIDSIYFLVIFFTLSLDVAWMIGDELNNREDKNGVKNE